MALTALAPYRRQIECGKSNRRCSGIFSEKSKVLTGGFNEAFVGGITSEATSQVIIALTTNGIDPRSELFTKNDISVLDHLLSFEAEDGGFKHVDY